MHYYEEDKIFEGLNMALTDAGFAAVKKPSHGTNLNSLFFKEKEKSLYYQSLGLPSKNILDHIDTDLMLLKAAKPGPSGIWIMARINYKVSNRAYCSSDKNPEILTINLNQTGIHKKIKSILSKMADNIDKLHEQEISATHAKIVNLLKSPKPKKATHIPFYQLIGLNECGFKVFDIYNQQRIDYFSHSKTDSNDIKERDNPSFLEIKIAISKFPIIFKIDDQTSFHPKSDFLFREERGKKTSENPLAFKIFMGSFSNISMTTPERPASLSTRIANAAFEDKDPLFYPVVTLNEDGSDKNIYYIPKAIFNTGGKSSLISRADPLDDIEYLYFSSKPIPKELFGRLKLSEANYRKLKDKGINYLNEMRETLLRSGDAHANALKLEELANSLNIEFGVTFFSKSTRIRYFTINNIFIYYAKNTSPSGKRKYAPHFNPLQPFPSRQYKNVKFFLNNLPERFSERQKRKDETNTTHAINLRQLKKTRVSEDLSAVIKENLKEFWKDIDYTATGIVKHAYQCPKAKDFYKHYINMCNPPSDPLDQPQPIEEISIPRAKYEWCHLIAHKDSLGDNSAGNMVAGSFHANTEQLAIETAIRASNIYQKIGLKITAYLVPSTPLFKNISPSSPLEIFIDKSLKTQPINNETNTQYKDWLTPERLYDLITKGASLESCSNEIIMVFIDSIIQEIYSIYKRAPSQDQLLKYYGFNTQKAFSTATSGLHSDSAEVEENESFALPTSSEIVPNTIKNFTLAFDDTSIRNALRSVFDKLIKHNYSHLPAAAFIRYRVFVGRHHAIDYVVDAMREEFDVNEYRMSYNEVLAELNSYEKESKPAEHLEQSDSATRGRSKNRDSEKDRSKKPELSGHSKTNEKKLKLNKKRPERPSSDSRSRSRTKSPHTS